jgi:hypothetical protein
MEKKQAILDTVEQNRRLQMISLERIDEENQKYQEQKQEK